MKSLMRCRIGIQYINRIAVSIWERHVYSGESVEALSLDINSVKFVQAYLTVFHHFQTNCKSGMK